MSWNCLKQLWVLILNLPHGISISLFLLQNSRNEVAVKIALLYGNALAVCDATLHTFLARHYQYA